MSKFFLFAILPALVYAGLSDNKIESVGLVQGTCPCQSTGWNCVSDCTGLADGDYQSCVCCHGTQAYVSCSGGRFYYRTCPANLVWADDVKQCNYTSSTCRECEWPPRTQPQQPVKTQPQQPVKFDRCPCKRTGWRCITSCTGRRDGDYQSCSCCHGEQAYISCVAGLMYYRPCPANLVWADNVKLCNYTSSTCHECVFQSDSFLNKWINL